MTVELAISVSTRKQNSVLVLQDTCPPEEWVSSLIIYLPSRFDFSGQDRGIAVVYTVRFHTGDIPQLDGVELTVV